MKNFIASTAGVFLSGLLITTAIAGTGENSTAGQNEKSGQQHIQNRQV